MTQGIKNVTQPHSQQSLIQITLSMNSIDQEYEQQIEIIQKAHDIPLTDQDPDVSYFRTYLHGAGQNYTVVEEN